MIRILQVVPSLDIGAGMMSVVMNYYRQTDRTKIQFDFLYFDREGSSHAAEIEELGGRTFFMKIPTLLPADQEMLRRFFDEHKGEFYAVHCHPIWAFAAIGPQARRSGIKHVIQHCHSTRYSEKRLSAVRNRLLIALDLRAATDLAACSEEAAVLFGRRRAAERKVFILRNAIDLDRYSFDRELREETRRSLGVGRDAPLIGTIGRHSFEKNQLYAVDVFKAFRDICPGSRGIMVGEGPMRPRIEERIRSSGMEKDVIMTGSRKDVRALLSAMDLFILPSLFEGTPVSVVEALASGLPCLLSDTVTRSLSAGGVRYLSIKADPRVWAEEGMALMNERRDHDRSDVKEVAALGLDIAKVGKALEEYYMGLVKNDERGI